jgi:hypothetical protein
MLARRRPPAVVVDSCPRVDPGPFRTPAFATVPAPRQDACGMASRSSRGVRGATFRGKIPLEYARFPLESAVSRCLLFLAHRGPTRFNP